MEKLVVNGGKGLAGRIRVSGAKNAVLPILAASLLADGVSTIEDVPRLADVETIIAVLTRLGANVRWNGGSVVIEADNLISTEAPYEYVRKMRAAFLVMGPLLARMGHSRISLPGGCAIGSRPIDLHLKGFAALGADINMGQGFVEATAGQLQGSTVYLDFPSVGATENIMMAATLARGRTILENAAEEPEIVDLANYLNEMGARIRGAGTRVIKVDGVEALHGVNHHIIPDRIEAGTFLAAAVLTGSDIVVENAVPEHLTPVIAKLQEAGGIITEVPEGLRVIGPDVIRPFDIKTLPYPGFPTDLQAQLMVLATVAKGTSVFTETVFENRFMHVDELCRMGAQIKISGRTAVIEGVEQLTGTTVKATDLRAGAALVMAGLVARGQTQLVNLHHLDRGYVKLEEKLTGIGADITREHES